MVSLFLSKYSVRLKTITRVCIGAILHILLTLEYILHRRAASLHLSRPQKDKQRVLIYPTEHHSFPGAEFHRLQHLCKHHCHLVSDPYAGIPDLCNVAVRLCGALVSNTVSVIQTPSRCIGGLTEIVFHSRPIVNSFLRPVTYEYL